MTHTRTIVGQQFSIGKVGIIETIVFTSQLEVFIVNRRTHARILLPFHTIEQVECEVLGKSLLVGCQELGHPLLATRRLEAVRAVERLRIVQRGLDVGVLGIYQVAVIEARHRIAVIHGITLVVRHLASKHKVGDGLIRNQSIEDEARVLGASLVFVAAIVRRYTRVDTLQVGQLVPRLIACPPVDMSLKRLIVGHVLVASPVVNGRDRTSRPAGCAVLDVCRHLNGHLL